LGAAAAPGEFGVDVTFQDPQPDLDWRVIPADSRLIVHVDEVELPSGGAIESVHGFLPCDDGMHDV
jgi:hypothetical protein